MGKRVNRCPSWDEHWGCAISPMKDCSSCGKAEWHVEGKDKPKQHTLKIGEYEEKLAKEKEWYANANKHLQGLYKAIDEYEKQNE